MDDTLMSTNSTFRDNQSDLRSSKSNSPQNAAVQPIASGQNRRCYSNPLMGAGIQITGTNQLLIKSDEMRFKAKRDEDNRKPINMKQLLAEQRRKFLAQQEEDRKEKEKELLRQAKLKKLRGNSVLIIDEASYEGSSVDQSERFDGEEREDNEEDTYDIGIKIEHEERVRTNRRSLGLRKKSDKMLVEVERSRTIVDLDKSSSGYAGSSNMAKDTSYGINSASSRAKRG